MATYEPLGETFAVFTFADRVNIARPVGSDEAARGAGSACLQDASSARSAINGMRMVIDVRLPRKRTEPDRWGSRQRPGFEPVEQEGQISELLSPRPPPASSRPA